ncbi:MAG: DEAD/DEAH box helicase [Treponema sp.]|nr:DEAD/DEAH box helicase [Candidatus Treponema caballi]
MSDYSFSSTWLPRLEAKNITTPTPVQKAVIPVLMDGKDVLFQSETGTGKTIAFLIPFLEKINPEIRDVQLIIAVPTHELASQIKAEVQSLTDMKAALLIGGAPLKRQQELLKEKPLIIIGSPARLIELIRIKKLKVEKTAAFVLDEADRLFAPELRDASAELTRLMPQSAQIAACSATVKPKLADIIQESMNARFKDGDPASSHALELILLPPEDILQRKITHWAFFAEQREKIDLLRKLLFAEKPSKTLIFTSRPDQVENIASKLQFKNIPCEALHARADKQERKAAIDRFRSGKATILITSDLASRGLDFPGITHIIQMDVPVNDDFFIHRSGRTARAGATGINILIGDAHEMRQLARMEKRLHITVYPKQLFNGKVSDF